jgi:hypothetical protein
MSIRDEQATNTTVPGEPIPSMPLASPPDDEVQGEMGFRSRTLMTPGSSMESVNRYVEPDGYVPHREEFQGIYDRQGVTARSAIFGGLSGGIFFFGLVAAILSGHFWPVFLVALAFTSLVGSLSSSKAQAIYGGFQGFVFFLGLAICSIYDWWWPGILVLLGIEALLSIGNGLLAPWPVAWPSSIADRYYAAIRNHDYAQAYRFLDASLTASFTQEQFTSIARSYDAAEGTVSMYAIAPDLAITATPLPEEPLPLVDFARNPAESITVTVRRMHGPSYMVHLQVRQLGKSWKITAFDRI